MLPELASVRITAYEEGGKMIGHRILPVIGLCPGFRHLTLRNELGQPLLLTTLFLCIVVKDYVPDGLSDFAEALANPIKYQSELEKRAEQLAVLTDDIELLTTVEEDMGHGSSSAGATKKDIKFLDASSGSPKPRTASIAASSALSVDILPDDASDSSNYCVAGSSTSQLPVVSLSGVSSQSTSNPGQSSQTTVDQAQAATSSTKSAEAVEADSIVAESLEKILEHKLIKEKRYEMEKKLESLRKKHDKEKLRVCSAQKSGDQADKKSKFYMGNKLVKRLSSKNM